MSTAEVTQKAIERAKGAPSAVDQLRSDVDSALRGSVWQSLGEHMNRTASATIASTLQGPDLSSLMPQMSPALSNAVREHLQALRLSPGFQKAPADPEHGAEEGRPLQRTTARRRRAAVKILHMVLTAMRWGSSSRTVMGRRGCSHRRSTELLALYRVHAERHARNPHSPAYLAGLLPDNADVREATAGRLGVSSESQFALIAKIGATAREPSSSSTKRSWRGTLRAAANQRCRHRRTPEAIARWAKRLGVPGEHWSLGGASVEDCVGDEREGSGTRQKGCRPPRTSSSRDSAVPLAGSGRARQSASAGAPRAECCRKRIRVLRR